jgi:hypothetical protein
MLNLKITIMKNLMLSLFMLLIVSILSIQAQNDSIAKSLELPPAAIEKLSSDQILELAKEKEKLKCEHEKAMAEKGMELPQKLIKEMMPSEFVMVIGPIFFLAFLLMLVIIPFYFNQQNSKTKFNLLSKIIDKDKDIPKELLSLEKKPRSDLHKAIILICLGLSIGLFLFVLKLEKNYWTIGLIPTIIGIGYFISFKFDKTNKSIQE